MIAAPLTQADIEREIARLSGALEIETDDYRDRCDEAAAAEADYKLAHAQSMLVTIDRSDLTSAPMRESYATVRSADQLRAFKIADARRAASREALMSLRTRIDALRTLSANVRAQT